MFTLSATGEDARTLTVEDGTLTVDNIAYGTKYTLTETTAPDGYNLLTDSITFTINTSGEVTFNFGTNNGEVATFSKDASGNITIIVKNEAGYVLPSTGGYGTWMYTLTGLTLCGAALVLYRKKRTK